MVHAYGRRGVGGGRLSAFVFNAQKVIKLLKAIYVSKATKLDKIPNRLLKIIAAEVVASTLTGIFNQSLVTGIFIVFIVFVSCAKHKHYEKTLKSSGKCFIYDKLLRHTNKVSLRFLLRDILHEAFSTGYQEGNIVGNHS